MHRDNDVKTSARLLLRRISQYQEQKRCVIVLEDGSATEIAQAGRKR